VLAGTLVAAGDAPRDFAGVLGVDSGSVADPTIGAADATGSARLLLEAGFTISRDLAVAASGTGSQEAILGGRGTGTSTYAEGVAIRIGRTAVTLEAGAGNLTRFQNTWADADNNPNPSVAFAVGTPDNTGTVLLTTGLPDAATAVNVRHGTLRLGLNSGNTIGPATPVTIANAAMLDLDGREQELTNLSLTSTAARVLAGGTGGILRMLTGGTLAGSGTIGSLTSIAGIHSPGQSPGLQTFESGLTYGSSSTLVWELSANTNLTADRGVLYDGINLTGGALSITPGATLSLVFDAPLADATLSTVNFSDAFWGQDRSWTIIDLAEGTTWDNILFTNFVVGNDANNVALTTARPDAQFFLSQTDGNLVLNYSVIIVPEPAGLALAALGLVAAVGLRRRQTGRSAATRSGSARNRSGRFPARR
jgi:hypothetical protein